MYIPIILYCRN